MGGAFFAALAAAGPGYAGERFQCSIETQAAQAIVDLRDRGQPKAFVLAPLPPREAVFNGKKGSLQARLAVQMHSIIEDVYANPDIKAAPYAAYRMAACTHRIAGRKVPMRFSEVALPMSGCQEKHGNQPSAALTKCVDEVLEYFQKSGAAAP
jgi:hypothetical protein